MTSIEGLAGFPKFALFASGAGLSREVLRQLRAKRCLPACVVLPEFEPAAAVTSGLELARVETAHEWRDLIGDLPIWYAPELHQDALVDRLALADVEFLLIACWPYLIDTAVFSAVTGAALNLHPSLLPEYRGIDPIGDQLRAGRNGFGVSLHLLTDEFDRGDIVAQIPFRLTLKPDRAEVEKEAGRLGVELFLRALQQPVETWSLQAQPDQASETV